MRGTLLIATMPTTPDALLLNDKQFSATMSNTTGQTLCLGAGTFRDLCGVVDEKQEVIDIASGRMPIEALDLPSVDQVVNSLRRCGIAPFACHGSTNYTDPSSSGLV